VSAPSVGGGPEAREAPLVSFCLFTYKQERFIEQSVRSALAQDYPNLEVILSDDRSPDRTAEILREAVRSTPTRHQVTVNVNERNLGLIPHVNHVLARARGEIIVVMSGDDVSYPHRVSAVVETLRDSPASILLSDADTIDERGKLIGHFYLRRPGPITAVRMAERGNSMTPGFSLGMRREVFHAFGPLPVGLENEDDQIGFRGALLGGVEYLDERLVAYRVHDGSLSSVWRSTGIGLAEGAKLGAREARNRRNQMRAWKEMLRSPATRLPEDEKARIEEILERRIRHHEWAEQMMTLGLRERVSRTASELARAREGRSLMGALALAASPGGTVVAGNRYRRVRGVLGAAFKRLRG
jgi:glycosyltransferase involved in cell wall biosynthesis